MSTRVQRRRGSAAAHATFIGAEGELTVMTDEKRVVVHDGATAGGIPMARLDEITDEVQRAIGNADFSFQITDRLVVPSTAFTAPRTGTLPAASSVAAGRTISFFDALPALNGANVLTVVRAGSDTLNGAASFICATPRGRWDFISDGVSKWSVARVSAASVVNVPSGGLSATNVQAAINELAAALGNDANFAATVTAALAGKQAALGFAPIQQGGGTGQGSNKIYVGWGVNDLLAQVDAVNLGRVWTDYSASASSGIMRLPNKWMLQYAFPVLTTDGDGYAEGLWPTAFGSGPISGAPFFMVGCGDGIYTPTRVDAVTPSAPLTKFAIRSSSIFSGSVRVCAIGIGAAP